MSKVEERLAKRVEVAKGAFAKVSKDDLLAQRKSKKILKRAKRKLAKMRAAPLIGKAREAKRKSEE